MKHLLFALVFLGINLTSSLACERHLTDKLPEEHFKKFDHHLNGQRPKSSGKSSEDIARAKYDKWQGLLKNLSDESTPEELLKVKQAYDDLALAMNKAAKDGEGYYVVPMQNHYHGENKMTKFFGKEVRYVEPAERLQHRITIRDGKFYDNKGALVTTGERGDIFVMDHSGEIYILPGSWKTGDFSIHHSSVLGGMPVAAAGEMEIKNGVLTYLADKSGHYGPPALFIKQAQAELVARGVDLDSFEFKSWSHYADERRLSELRTLGLDL